MSTWHQSDLSQLAPEAQWLERAKELDALISVDEPAVTALANAAAFIWASLDRINWAGFYLFDGEKLVLGPFMGKPACTVIAMGKGVCGLLFPVYHGRRFSLFRDTLFLMFLSLFRRLADHGF